jgi:hypothetical protein
MPAYAAIEVLRVGQRHLTGARQLGGSGIISEIPDPRFSHEYLFSEERLRRWNRTTL